MPWLKGYSRYKPIADNLTVSRKYRKIYLDKFRGLFKLFGRNSLTWLCQVNIYDLIIWCYVSIDIFPQHKACPNCLYYSLICYVGLLFYMGTSKRSQLSSPQGSFATGRFATNWWVRHRFWKARYNYHRKVRHNVGMDYKTSYCLLYGNYINMINEYKMNSGSHRRPIAISI